MSAEVPPAKTSNEPYIVGGSRRLQDLEITLPQVLDSEGEPRTFKMNPDPDVELVGLLLQIEEVIRTGSSPNGDMTVAGALIEGKRVIVSELQAYNQDVPDSIRLGAGDVLEIITYINAGKSAASAVASSITRAADAFAEEAGAMPELEESTTTSEEGDEEPTPLRSRSNGKSSRSAKRTTGKRTTGSTSRTRSGKRNSSRQRAA